MDRVCRFIGESHIRYNKGDIISVQPGGDTDNFRNEYKSHLTDDEWEAYKASILDTLKQNALQISYSGKNLTEAEIQVQWESTDGTHWADWDAQMRTYEDSIMTYDMKRKKEYPNLNDQMDKIYHEGIDAWKNDMIKPVKDKYAKE